MKLNQKITVYVKSDFEKAVKEQFGVITVEGEVADLIVKEANSKMKKAGRKVSWGSLVAGLFFWPLLITGFTGLALTKNDLVMYNFSVCDSTKVVLTHKKNKCKY